MTRVIHYTLAIPAYRAPVTAYCGRMVEGVRTSVYIDAVTCRDCRERLNVTGSGEFSDIWPD